MKFRISLYIFISILLLVSCKPSKNVQTMPIIVPSSTSTFQPGLTHTFEPPLSTITPTLISTKDIKESTTSWAEKEKTRIASFPVECENNEQTVVSPGGTWAAIYCLEPNNQRIILTDYLGTMWTLKYSNYLTEYTLDEAKGYGYTGGLAASFWTVDESYLYFNAYMGCDCGGTCFYGSPFSIGIYQLNLSNGVVNTILSQESTNGSFYYAFSPDGRYLAYATGRLVLLDLNNLKETIVRYPTSNNSSIGDIVWSPDSSKIAYSTCNCTSEEFELINSSVEMYSLHSMKRVTLFESSKYRLTIFNEAKDNSFLICENVINESIVVDWSTNQLLGTATPEY